MSETSTNPLLHSPMTCPPGPVFKKKRVTRTVYWEACPVCDERVLGWSQNADERPCRRTYTPCGCEVVGAC